MANPEEGGTLTGTGVYNFGDTCTLSATANDNFVFNCWTKENGPIVSTDSSFCFTVTEGATYIANFSSTCNVIGSGIATSYFLPSYSRNKYSISQQIYTADEVGNIDTINSVSFFNDGYTNTRKYTIYLVNTTQNNYSSSTDWVMVTDDDMVFSGDVNLTAGEWTTIELTEPFIHDGTNLAILVDDNTGSYTESNSRVLCRVFDTESNQSVEMESDFTNFTPFAPPSGMLRSNKNQIVLNMGEIVGFETFEITAETNPSGSGTVLGEGTYLENTASTLIAKPNQGYAFVNWTKDGQVVSANATYTFIVTEDATIVANFREVGGDITQTTNFNNGWNWWSSFIELDGANSLQSLENSLGTNGMMIKSQNDGYASYLEGFGWYGSLTTINNESTYQIRANEACTVEMTGSVANPAEHPIELHSGWTWVGYPVAVSMGVEDALAGIEPLSGDMLKSQNDGFASYLEGFGWYGSLSILNPGMGLMYKSNNSSPITLVYPNNGTRNDLKANQTADNNHWQPNLNAYPDNMNVMAVVELDGEELALRQAQGPDNYELAVFANGECRGSARLMYVEPLNRYMAFLTVAGDEAAELRFGLYNTETGEECIDSDNVITYVTNAVIGNFAEPYIVSFRGNTGVDEWANSLQIFPTPVERGQKVSLGFNDVETGEVQVEIINVLGAIVETRRATSLQTITAPETAGVYTLRITVEGKGMCYRKLIVK